MLQVFVNNNSLVLPENFELDIELKNPMFNDTESFSHPVSVPFKGNRHILSNLDSLNSTVRPIALEHTPMRINVSGIPVFTGEMETSDDEELTDELAINAVGGRDFKTLISDLQCRDIPVKDEILIGEKLGRVKADFIGDKKVEVYVGTQEGAKPNDEKLRQDYFDITLEQGVSATASFLPPMVGFCVQGRTSNTHIYDIPEKTITGEVVDGYTPILPDILESYINVDKPYPFPYCNARIAYKHLAAGDGDEVDSDNPYLVLEADRPASGVCFYVLYFLDCLFAYLGLEWDNSELMQIEDMKRLCFFTTKCSYYEVPDVWKTEKDEDGNDIEITEHEYANFEYINSWLEKHGCGSTISLGESESKPCGNVFLPKGTFLQFTDPNVLTELLEDVVLPNKGSVEVNVRDYVDTIAQGTMIDEYVDQWNDLALAASYYNPVLQRVTAEYNRMYADSGNFPEDTVTSLIESLENQFGIRFIYDAESHKVTARLLRNMYRSQNKPYKFTGYVDSVTPVVEKFSGVRICYSEESNSKEQQNNIRDNVKDYSLDYDYIDYPDPAKPMGARGMAPACTTVINETYKDFVDRTDRTDNTCYIDQFTGDAYRIKVNSEAANPDELQPAWFEAGGYKGIELGDCSKDNEDNIIELASSLQPVIMSDVNADNVRAAASTTDTSINNVAYTEKANQPVLSAFFDEDMKREYTEMNLTYPADIKYGEMNVNVKIKQREAFEPTDSGNSPLQEKNWGLAVSIMRGGGTESTVQIYDANYDGCGNYRWMTTVGTYAMTPDSLDALGNEYDYNGSDLPGIVGEHFSLKIRAYKQPEWADAPLCRDDYVDTDGNKHYIRSRGTGDRFMIEHAHFLLNRRKFLIRGTCEAITLAEIQNHWQDRWEIAEKIGYIDMVEAHATNKTDLLEYTITFYEI